MCRWYITDKNEMKKMIGAVTMVVAFVVFSSFVINTPHSAKTELKNRSICYSGVTYAQDISGTWSSRLVDEPNIVVKITKNPQGKYLLTVSYDGHVASFIESKREQEVVNNEIEYSFLFDCSGKNKPEMFKEGLCLTFYSKTNRDIPSEINIRCRDYQYRYETWNVFRN